MIASDPSWSFDYIRVETNQNCYHRIFYVRKISQNEKCIHYGMHLDYFYSVSRYSLDQVYYSFDHWSQSDVLALIYLKHFTKLNHK